jgi:hypothetical protein
MMEGDTNKTLYEAFKTLFRPLARILIRNGIAFGTLSDWAKKVYVDVAFEEFGEPGKKQTISRVSALTGIFRKEVKRLYELDEEADEGSAQRYNRAIRVISGWVNDARFQEGVGKPRDLPVEGEQGSFTALVKEYSGDIPTKAMLSVLRAAGTVTETEDGLIRLEKRAFIPGDDQQDKIHILGTDVSELIETIDHNLTAESDDLRYQRKVSNTAVHEDALPVFRNLSAQKSQELLEELDAWLSRNEIHSKDKDFDDKARYVSLGIYYYDRPAKTDDEEEQS